MAEYRVINGVIIHNSKPHTINDVLELTDAEYENVKINVQPIALEKVANGEKKLESMTAAELKALADAKGLEVQGTGKDGAVIKADYLNALQ